MDTQDAYTPTWVDMYIIYVALHACQLYIALTCMYVHVL